MWAVACGPYLILAFATWLVAGRRAPTPLDGRPVLLLAGLMGLVCLLVNASIVATQHHAPQHSAAERQQVHRGAKVGWAITYFVALLYAGIVLHIPLGSPVVFALVIPWIVTAGLLWLWQPAPAPASETEPAVTAPAIDRDQEFFWTGLGFYDNPDDPHAVVPKRVGIGYTFNVGNPTGRRLMHMFFGSIILLVVASVACGHLMHRI